MLPLLAVLLSSPVAAQPPTQGKAVPILARGPWPHLPVDQGHPPAGVSQQRAIRSERELAEVAGAHALPAVARALGVKGIDFKKQMLIAVTGPRQPLVGVSGGGPPSAPARVEVARVERDGGGQVLTVSWRLVPRGAEILTAPLAVVLVDRFDGRVEFARLPDGKEKPAAGNGVKIRARAFWPDGWKAEAPPRQWVVRSYAELIDPRLAAPEPVLERMRQESLARYLKALKVKAINFNKQMLVGASGGAQPAGARVEITQIVQGGGRLSVHWKLHAPKAGAAPPELTHPAEVVLVERFAGDIRFDPAGRPNEPVPVPGAGRGHPRADKPPAPAEGLGEEGYADSGGVKIHYVTLGQGPLVILIHGFPDYWYTWRDQMPALAKHFQVVAIDQRGFNKSGQPEGVANYALDKLVEDVHAVLRHFKRKEAVLVGHDWGGLVAWTFAMTHPDKTKKLIVLNLPHPKGLMRELASNPQQQKNSQYARNFQAEGAAAKLTAEALVFWVKEPEARKHYLAALRRSSMEGMLNYYKANYPKEPYKDDKTFPPVKCPVLLIHGLKDPFLLPGALNDTWKWVKKDLTLVTVPEAGHFVHRDAPALVTRRILRWLTDEEKGERGADGGRRAPSPLP